MAKPKCANCGEPMIEAYTRIGLRIFICPHVRMNTVKAKSGITKEGHVYCHINIDGIRASFDKLTEKSNVTVESLRAATKNTVNDSDLLENANLGIMLGLPVNSLNELFEAAHKLGYALGIDTKKAVQALCKGIGRRSRLILDNIGIAFKAQEAYAWYKSVNRLGTLDEMQRTEAWQKYAIKLITEKAKVLEA